MQIAPIAMALVKESDSMLVDLTLQIQAYIDKVTMQKTFINFGEPMDLKGIRRTQRMLQHAMDLLNNGWQVVVVGPNMSWCSSKYEDLGWHEPKVHLLKSGQNQEDICESSGIWLASIAALQQQDQWDWKRLRMTYDTDDNLKRRYLVDPTCIEINLLSPDPAKFPRAAFEFHRYDEDDTNQWIAGDVLLNL